MKVIVAGSTRFNDYALLALECDNILGSKTNIEIISGSSSGADHLGQEYATKKGFPIKKFPLFPNYYRGGPWGPGSASYKRHAEMAEYADSAIIFWDARSGGTRGLINFMQQYGLEQYGLSVTIILCSIVRKNFRDSWVKHSSITYQKGLPEVVNFKSSYGDLLIEKSKVGQSSGRLTVYTR